MRFLRLLTAIFSTSLQRELAHRTNLIFQIFLTATGIAAGVVALRLVYTQTQTLAGWSLGEALVLLGTFQIISGILSTFIEPNIVWFAGQISRGELDDMLLKPVSSLFLASLGTCAPLGLAQVGLGLIVTTTGLGELGASLTLWRVVAWLLMLIIGIMITWASRVLTASIAFWVHMDLDVLYGALWQLGRYPIDIYHPAIRFLLTYILPLTFIATIPTRILTGDFNPALLIVGLAAGLGAVVIVRTVWQLGLRRYTSATS
jgi:ABC-2 type transport system permease protein